MVSSIKADLEVSGGDVDVDSQQQVDVDIEEALLQV